MSVWALLVSAHFLAAPSATAEPDPTPSVPPGIHTITATPEFLYLQGETGATPLLLMEQEPWDSPAGAVKTEPLATIQSPARFEVAIPRFDGAHGRVYRGFRAVRVLSNGSTEPVGHLRHVSVWRGISSNRDPFPKTSSKKGLQVQVLDDAIALGIQHAALNLNLAQLIETRPTPQSLRWDIEDLSIPMSAGYVESLDRQIRTLSDKGITVSLIILAYQSGNPQLDRVLLHPKFDPTSPNHLGAFNTSTPNGVVHYLAAMEFLAHRYCQTNYPHGRVANFILGNEVNSHWFWSNRGRCTMEEFAEDYLRVMRLAHAAIRKTSASARVYLSLEHHWNIHYPGGKEDQTFAARPFLEYFHRRSVEEGDFDWHVAFHPYPENLFECRTWNDRSATDAPDTPRITFKNLDQLTRFLAQSEFQYNPSPEESFGPRTRRVILSEQGFHAVAGPEGELWQAAAYAYAYRKAAANAGIDSFILHRHVDHSQEGGLNLGLWTRKTNSIADPDRPRRIYEVFKHADQKDWKETFEFALPIIGLHSWEQLTK